MAASKFELEVNKIKKILIPLAPIKYSEFLKVLNENYINNMPVRGWHSWLDRAINGGNIIKVGSQINLPQNAWWQYVISQKFEPKNENLLSYISSVTIDSFQRGDVQTLKDLKKVIKIQSNLSLRAINKILVFMKHADCFFPLHSATELVTFNTTIKCVDVTAQALMLRMVRKIVVECLSKAPARPKDLKTLSKLIFGTSELQDTIKQVLNSLLDRKEIIFENNLYSVPQQPQAKSFWRPTWVTAFARPKDLKTLPKLIFGTSKLQDKMKQVLNSLLDRKEIIFGNNLYSLPQQPQAQNGEVGAQNGKADEQVEKNRS